MLVFYRRLHCMLLLTLLLQSYTPFFHDAGYVGSEKVFLRVNPISPSIFFSISSHYYDPFGSQAIQEIKETSSYFSHLNFLLKWIRQSKSSSSTPSVVNQPRTSTTSSSSYSSSSSTSLSPMHLLDYALSPLFTNGIQMVDRDNMTVVQCKDSIFTQLLTFSRYLSGLEKIWIKANQAIDKVHFSLADPSPYTAAHLKLLERYYDHLERHDLQQQQLLAEASTTSFTSSSYSSSASSSVPFSSASSSTASEMKCPSSKKSLPDGSVASSSGDLYCKAEKADVATSAHLSSSSSFAGSTTSFLDSSASSLAVDADTDASTLSLSASAVLKTASDAKSMDASSAAKFAASLVSTSDTTSSSSASSSATSSSSRAADTSSSTFLTTSGRPASATCMSTSCAALAESSSVPAPSLNIFSSFSLLSSPPPSSNLSSLLRRQLSSSLAALLQDTYMNGTFLETPSPHHRVLEKMDETLRYFTPFYYYGKYHTELGQDTMLDHATFIKHLTAVKRDLIDKLMHWDPYEEDEEDVLEQGSSSAASSSTSRGQGGAGGGRGSGGSHGRKDRQGKLPHRPHSPFIQSCKHAFFATVQRIDKVISSPTRRRSTDGMKSGGPNGVTTSSTGLEPEQDVAVSHLHPHHQHPHEHHRHVHHHPVHGQQQQQGQGQTSTEKPVDCALHRTSTFIKIMTIASVVLVVLF